LALHFDRCSTFLPYGRDRTSGGRDGAAYLIVGRDYHKALPLLFVLFVILHGAWARRACRCM
jgi:hypothetical protein